MIEKQLEDRMHAALAGEPPLGFDPDELVDRAARRRRQRRSTLAAAGVAGTVLLLAAVGIVVTGDRGAERPDIGTPTVSGTPTSASSPPRPVCQSVQPGRVPPAGFTGSAEILERLEQDVPDLITAHLGGSSVVPADEMVAYDCPPTIGAGYSIAGTANTLALSLVHARPKTDFGHDPYAGHARFRLLREQPQPERARVRVYEEFTGESGALVVIRFGADGMITEVSTARPDEVAEQDLIALVNDPALRFPLPR